MCSIAFVSHGGGPMPLLGDPGHAELVSTMKSLATELPKQPSAIVMVSAHWETAGIELTAAATPEMIYDYYGFPEEAYQLKYPAPGAPQLAGMIADEMEARDIHIRLNASRGFDHGMYVPLMLMYPNANIPVLQLSLDSSLSPEKHWQLGEQLSQVLPDDALLIGSGFTFHNMRAFFSPQSSTAKASVHAFQQWLDETVTGESVTMEEAKQRWQEWDSAEGGRYCHPREEHLIPLVVCHAAAQRQAKSIAFNALNVEARHFFW